MCLRRDIFIEKAVNKCCSSQLTYVLSKKKSYVIKNFIIEVHLDKKLYCSKGEKVLMADFSVEFGSVKNSAENFNEIAKNCRA